MPVQKNIKTLIAQYNQNRNSIRKDCFCYVPFMNLLFTQGGQVKTCCYNEKVCLGTYPQQSIAEMWNNDILKQTRQAMLDNDLNTAGCAYCENMLLQSKFYGIKPGTYDQYLPYLQGNQPIVLEFELNNTCNLECIMCNGYTSSAIRRNRDKLPGLPSPYDDKFVEQLRPFLPKLKEARFFGGEPFLIDIYYKIWELILEVNPEIRIYTLTNGTVWNKKIDGLVSRLNIDLGISVDAMDKKIFESIRKNASFDKVMENIQKIKKLYLKKKPGRAVTISTTPILQNIEQIPLIVDYCNQNEFYLWLSTVEQPESLSLAYAGNKLLQHYLGLLEQKYFPNNTVVEKHNLAAYQGFLNQLKYWINSHV